MLVGFGFDCKEIHLNLRSFLHEVLMLVFLVQPSVAGYHRERNAWQLFGILHQNRLRYTRTFSLKSILKRNLLASNSESYIQIYLNNIDMQMHVHIGF